jgi:hypothetical protein
MLASVGCTCRPSHKRLVGHRNFDLGRLAGEIPEPDPKVEPIDDQTSRYTYEYEDTVCQRANTVDNATHRILSWQFISDPKRRHGGQRYGLTSLQLGPHDQEMLDSSHS